MIYTAFFYLIAGLILFSAYFVVTARNLFRCAVGLISVLVGIAGMYLLMDAQFLSAVQITVYVGGIVILIIFAILLVADVTQKVYRQCPPWRKGVVGALAALFFVVMTWAALAFDFSRGKSLPAPKSATIADLGRSLLGTDTGGFALPFEVLSVLLIAALIGAITVARSDEEAAQSREEKP